MASWLRNATASPPAARPRRRTGRVGETIVDNHALLLPSVLPAGDYKLIVGLYDINDSAARLPVGEGTYFELGTVTLQSG